MCFAAIGPIMSVAGTIASGLAAQQQAKYQQRLHEMNARAARAAAAAEAERFHKKSERSLATQRIVQATSGADPNSGSFLEGAAGGAKDLALDELSILHGGEMEAHRELAAARYAKAQGREALSSAIFQGAQSLLGSLPSFSPSSAPLLKEKRRTR